MMVRAFTMMVGITMWSEHLLWWSEHYYDGPSIYYDGHSIYYDGQSIIHRDFNLNISSFLILP